MSLYWSRAEVRAAPDNGYGRAYIAWNGTQARAGKVAVLVG